jgi:hypothetical protein
VSDTTSGATKGYPNESSEDDHLEVPPHYPQGGTESGVQPADPTDPRQTEIVRESERHLQELAAEENSAELPDTTPLNELGQPKRENQH